VDEADYTVKDSAKRKLDSGLHNPDYQGELSVAEVNRLRAKFGTGFEFYNANIVGDITDWSEYAEDKYISFTGINISLVGDYNDWRDGKESLFDSVGVGVSANIDGVLDIEGTAPFILGNDKIRHGYLILHNISTETLVGDWGVVQMPDNATQAARVYSKAGVNLNYSMAVIYANKASNNANMLGAYRIIGGKQTGMAEDGYGEYGSMVGEPAPFSIDPADWAAKGKVSDHAELEVDPSSVPGVEQWTLTDFNALSAN
jgi:hypothetical protein